MEDGIYAVDKSARMHRIASSLVLGVWLVLAFLSGGIGPAIKTFLFYLLPLFCIWFPDAMAQYTGVVVGRGRHIDQPSNPTFLKYGGWFVLLLVPLLIMLIFSVSK